MNNSAVNFTVDEASSNLTTFIFNAIDILDFNILGFSFLFGLLTNAYVIWLIITGAESRVASEFFTLNLAVCGLIFSLNSLLSICTKVWFPSLVSLSNFMLGVVITGYPLFQCLICVERFVAVVHPVTFLKYKPLRYRLICCSVTWIITLGSCLIYMHRFLIFTQYIYMLLLSTQFLFFLSIQMFCCLAVLRALKQAGPGERGRGREKVKENHMKRRAFYLILMITVNTVITYAPLTITALIFIVTEHLFLLLWSVGCVFFMLAGFLPPVLYLRRIGKLSRLSFCNILS